MRRLRQLPPRTWPRAVGWTVVAAVLIGVPSDLFDTPIFGRPVPVRSIDYVILGVTATLIGLTLAIRPQGPVDGDDRESSEDTRPVWAGFASFLAVGCPVCNQVVVLALGTSGALSWWAPVQPVVGLFAVGVAAWGLQRRLATFDLAACPLPASSSALSGEEARP